MIRTKALGGSRLAPRAVVLALASALAFATACSGGETEGATASNLTAATPLAPVTVPTVATPTVAVPTVAAPTVAVPTVAVPAVPTPQRPVVSTPIVDTPLINAPGAKALITNPPAITVPAMVAGAAVNLEILSGNSQSARVQTAFAQPLTIVLVDALGDVVAGVPVIFTAPSSGASATLTQAPALTDVLGQASVHATANAISGTYEVTASIVGLPLVSFRLTNLGSDEGAGGAGAGNGTCVCPGGLGIAGLGGILGGAGGSGVLGGVLGGAGGGGVLGGVLGGAGGGGVLGGVLGGVGGAGGLLGLGGGGGILPPLVGILTGEGSVTAGTTPTVPPLGHLTINASGGHGGYHFALMAHASGGSVNPTTGAYVAGAIGNVVDVVTITDSSGATTHLSIQVGPGITISPAAAHVAPLGTLDFVAVGGSGIGFHFALTANASASTLDVFTGVFTAGLTNGVDTITVTDSLGNHASTTLAVGTALTAGLAGGITSVPPRGMTTIVSSGGMAPLLSALTGNRSGASIDSMTGAYVAGATGNVTDTITVTDANGAHTEVQVMVGPPIAITATVDHAGGVAALNIHAPGGSGSGYTWSLSTVPGGGMLTVVAGVPGSDDSIYVGGHKSSADVIHVTDSLGNTAEASAGLLAVIEDGIELGGGGCSVAPTGTPTFELGGGLVGVALILGARRRRARA